MRLDYFASVDLKEQDSELKVRMADKLLQSGRLHSVQRAQLS